MIGSTNTEKFLRVAWRHSASSQGGVAQTDYNDPVGTKLVSEIGPSYSLLILSAEACTSLSFLSYLSRVSTRNESLSIGGNFHSSKPKSEVGAIQEPQLPSLGGQF